MLHFCSVNDMKAFLPAAGKDGALDMARHSATDLINQYTNRNLEFGNVTEVLDCITIEAWATYRIYLEKKNILAVSAISLRGVPYASAYALDADNGVLTLAGPLRFAPRGFTIAYSGGYPPLPFSDTDPTPTDVMACPEAVRYAAIRQGLYMYRALASRDDGSTDLSKGKQQVAKQKLVNGLLPEVAVTMNPFRRTRMRII